jgi:DNA end-binding protein Ku
MVLWTLRYGDEVRDEAEYFKGIKGKPGPKEKKLLSSLIAEHTRHGRRRLRPIQCNTLSS